MVATKSMTELTAADVMSHNVVSVPESMPLQEAAGLLAREQISGAPVVDGAGRCVGVLSATDFVRWVEQGPGPVHATKGHCFCADWQVIDLEMLPKDEVRWYMSTDLVSAEPATSVTDLARRMLDAHIHRIVVLDASRKPIGVVSSTDILAAVAYAPAERD
jgi:CBS-domain-containing membrane protein